MVYSGHFHTCTSCRGVVTAGGSAVVRIAVVFRLVLQNCAIRCIEIGSCPVCVGSRTAGPALMRRCFSPASLHVESRPFCNDVVIAVVVVAAIFVEQRIATHVWNLAHISSRPSWRLLFQYSWFLSWLHVTCNAYDMQGMPLPSHVLNARSTSHYYHNIYNHFQNCPFVQTLNRHDFFTPSWEVLQANKIKKRNKYNKQEKKGEKVTDACLQKLRK